MAGGTVAVIFRQSDNEDTLMSGTIDFDYVGNPGVTVTAFTDLAADNTTEHTFSHNLPNDGDYTMRVRVIDSAGQAAETTQSYKISTVNTGPTVTIVSITVT